MFRRTVRGETMNEPGIKYPQDGPGDVIVYCVCTSDRRRHRYGRRQRAASVLMCV